METPGDRDGTFALVGYVGRWPEAPERSIGSTEACEEHDVCPSLRCPRTLGLCERPDQHAPETPCALGKGWGLGRPRPSEKRPVRVEPLMVFDVKQPSDRPQERLFVGPRAVS